MLCCLSRCPGRPPVISAFSLLRKTHDGWTGSKVEWPYMSLGKPWDFSGSLFLSMAWVGAGDEEWAWELWSMLLYPQLTTWSYALIFILQQSKSSLREVWKNAPDHIAYRAALESSGSHSWVVFSMPILKWRYNLGGLVHTVPGTLTSTLDQPSIHDGGREVLGGQGRKARGETRRQK